MTGCRELGGLVGLQISWPRKDWPTPPSSQERGGRPVEAPTLLSRQGTQLPWPKQVAALRQPPGAPSLNHPPRSGYRATTTPLVETTNVDGSIQHSILMSIMDDEPMLDCIVVATRTDQSSTMAPKNKPSTTPSLGAGEVDAARGGPEQSQTTKTPSSSSTAAALQPRHVPVSRNRFFCSGHVCPTQHSLPLSCGLAWWIRLGGNTACKGQRDGTMLDVCSWFEPA